MRLLTETSTITDGNMAFRCGKHDEVLKNRQRFLKKFGLKPRNCVVMDSKHKDIITIIYDSGLQIVEADTLITQNKNLSLLLPTADCLPISFFDPVTETIGLIHLSRHTFALNLIEKTFDTLKSQLSVNLKNLLVQTGPHIKKDSYHFPSPLKEESDKLKLYLHKIGDQVHIDLTQATIDVFTNNNVQLKNIVTSEIDTYTSPNHFSHVRSVKQKHPEGRIATVVSFLDS